jgi:CubicO group peptidase (beta-lactamase class C family)
VLHVGVAVHATIIRMHRSSQPPHVRRDARGMQHTLDELVERAVHDGDAPGVVAAVARGDWVVVSTAGVMAIDGPPMRRDTLFRITSMTKPMTAAVVLTLVDEGVLRLDEPVDELLPELANRRVLRTPDGALNDTVPATRAITTRDLLTFTWGFGMQGAMFMAAEPWPIVTATIERALSTFGPPQPGMTPDPDTWMARLGELPLLAQPGERWLYQSGSQVLGVLAARATGMPFAELMQQRLFDPLAMSDTSFYTTTTGRLATAYARGSGGLIVSDPPDGQWSHPPAFADGGSGLLSTVDDVVVFGRMLLNDTNKILQPATVAAMTRDELTTSQRTNIWPGFSFLDDRGWGYGVAVNNDGRYGWDGGFGTTWSNIPARDLTVVVLTQRAVDETGPPAICEHVLANAIASAANASKRP